MGLTIVDRIREMREMHGVDINNFLPRRYLSNFEEAIEGYLKSGYNGISTGEGWIGLYNDPLIGIILATEHIESEDLYITRYVFFNKDGHILPDPECFGEINTKNTTMHYNCLRILHEGFVPVKK